MSLNTLHRSSRIVLANDDRQEFSSGARSADDLPQPLRLLFRVCKRCRSRRGQVALCMGRICTLCIRPKKTVLKTSLSRRRKGASQHIHMFHETLFLLYLIKND